MMTNNSQLRNPMQNESQAMKIVDEHFSMVKSPQEVRKPIQARYFNSDPYFSKLKQSHFSSDKQQQAQQAL